MCAVRQVLFSSSGGLQVDFQFSIANVNKTKLCMKVVNMFVIHLNTNKTIVLGMKRNRRKRKIQSMIYTSTRVMTPWRLLCTFVAVVVVVFFVFLCLPLCFTLNRHNFQMVTITLVSLLSIRRSYIFDYFLFVRFHLAEC